MAYYLKRFLVFIVAFLTQYSINSNLANAQTTSIKEIFIILGNAARTPLRVYPTDPYNSSYWYNYGGLDQTTPNGLLSQYNIGQYLKNYYSNFLSPVYSPEKVNANSMNRDNALSATSSFLSGMYPPANKYQIWSNGVSWFPIPVHTSNSTNDNLFLKPCPNYNSQLSQSLSSSNNLNVDQSNAAFINNMSINSGINPLNYYNIGYIYDSSMSELANNLPLPQWVNQNYNGISAANDYRLNLNYGNLNNAKLVSGGILNDILSQMNNKLYNSSSNEVTIYAGQDYNLNAMTTLLNVSSALPLKQQPYSSFMVFELRQDTSGNYYVQVLSSYNYTNGSIGMQPVQINGCNTLCPINNFYNLTTPNSVSDYNSACFSSSSPPPAQKNGLSGLEIGLIVATVLLGLLALALLGALLAFLLSRRRTSTSTTTPTYYSSNQQRF